MALEQECTAGRRIYRSPDAIGHTPPQLHSKFILLIVAAVKPLHGTVHCTTLEDLATKLLLIAIYLLVVVIS
jgi:hypothetical protein